MERLVSEALRNPFLEAPTADGPAVWNWKEAAEGIPQVSGPGDGGEGVVLTVSWDRQLFLNLPERKQRSALFLRKQNPLTFCWRGHTCLFYRWGNRGLGRSSSSIGLGTVFTG